MFIHSFKEKKNVTSNLKVKKLIPEKSNSDMWLI